MDKAKLKKVLDEISNAMTRKEAEQDYIKEAIKALSEEHGINKRVLRKMASTYHKRNYSEEKGHTEEFQTLYEEVIGEQ